MKARCVGRSAGEEVLAWELTAAGIPFEREVRFAPPRRWRFDFVIGNAPFAVEVDGGSWSGGHRRGAEADRECDKLNAAALSGWMVLHFTPAQVERGHAASVIKAVWAETVERELRENESCA